MAIKHSKFKNTGILFELLVRQITHDVLNGIQNSPAMKIMETHFRSSTELGKELVLYRSFFNDFKPLSEHRALDFLGMVHEQRSNLSNRKLAEEKYELVKALKEHYDVEEFFSHRVPSYKVYASIYKNLEARARGVTLNEFDDLVAAKSTLVEHLTGQHTPPPDAQKESEITEEMRKKDEGMRLLTYRVLLEKFNEKYKDLSPKQKALLHEYVHNVTNRTALLALVKSEAKAVSENIREALQKVTNPVTQIKLEEVVHQLDELTSVNQVRNNHLTALMIGYEIEKQLEESLQ